MKLFRLQPARSTEAMVSALKLAYDGEIRRFPLSALTLGPDGDFAPVWEYDCSALKSAVDDAFPGLPRNYSLTCVVLNVGVVCTVSPLLQRAGLFFLNFRNASFCLDEKLREEDK